MSTLVKHEPRPPRGTKLALILGAAWLLLLAATWYLYRGEDAEGGGFLNFLARFHVILVHLPIGVIFLGFTMDILSRFTAFAHLRKSLPFVLWIGFLGAIGATLAGYLLMNVEGYGGRAVDLHMYFGLAVTVTSLLALLFTLARKQAMATLAMVAAAFTTAASGHFGGALIHEADYLTEHAPEQVKPLLLVGLTSNEAPPEEQDASEEAEEAAEVPLSERAVYADFVVPILEAKCNECHNENKVKGKLRMDTHELLLAGAEGSDFPTVLPGNAEESEFIVRVTLPEDDDDFMPPKGDALTAEEIQLINLWIQAGAKEETTLAELGDDPGIEAAALAVAALHSGSGEESGESAGAATVSAWDSLAPEEQKQRMEDLHAAAAKYHFSVMPISAEDDRLRINVVNAAKEFGDDQVALLEPVAARIAWLDLARSQVTDGGMAVVGKMTGLERLHLENTQVTDDGIAKLGNLAQLEYLNLYGTGVGNGVLETFRGMPRLKKVYVWQTDVDPGEARAYERQVNLEINTGVDLAVVETPAAEAPAEKADAPPEKKPEPKPAEKTPEPKPAEKKPEPKKPEPAPKPEPKKPEPAPKPEPKKPDPKPAPQPEAKKPAPKPDTPPAPKPAEKKDA